MAMDNPKTATGRRIAVFGFDVAEASQIRRIRSFREIGHEVTSFTMRRANMNAGFQPEWPNFPLFRVDNEKVLKRAFVVAASVLKMACHRRTLRDADLIVARNLDMLAIAWAARRMASAEHVPLVYECLDIHAAMTGEGAKSRAMRKAERWLLGQVALLIVSSPGFIRHYFSLIQGYDGPWVLIENKLVANGRMPDRPRRRARCPGPRRQLGWIGTIRCPASLELLLKTAWRMSDRLDLHIHGIVHRHAIPDFDAMVAAHPNVMYYGAYDYPQDLVRAYSSCDLVWAQDLWQRGSNSDWLLPNRIYEAPWCGCLSIAVSDTETGRRIEEDGLGPVIAQPDPDALVACLDGLSSDRIAAWTQDLLDRPGAEFVQSDESLQRMVEQALTSRNGRAA